MNHKIIIGLILSISVLTIFAEEISAARKGKPKPPLILPVDGAEPPPEIYRGSSPVMFEGIQPECEDIHPTIGYQYVIQHDQFGSTYYDYQKNGSMGRMIAVGPGGHRHTIFHETRGPYGAQYPRYITYNCKDPLDVWLGPIWVDGGSGVNAGYTQMLVMHDGREVILYHTTAESPPQWSKLTVGDAGFICSGSFSNLYDLPDRHRDFVGEGNGYWPKGCIVHDAEVDTDYIHIVTTEPVASAGNPHTIGYQRCVFQGNTLVCREPGGGIYTREPNTAYPSPLDVIAPIDTIMTISAIPASSPVSRRVAIAYCHNRDNYDTQVNNDIYYIESMNNGEDWLDGTQWPPTKINVTNYQTGELPRAYTDLALCYDYNDSLHIVWNAHDYDSVAGTITLGANLYHWSKATGISMIADAHWGGTNPVKWCRNIAKMSISALDPIYHPGGDPDLVYLYSIWVQCDSGDMSLGGYSNGDIYASISSDGGAIWSVRVNLTNTKTPDCAPGECLSEHWPSLSENLYDGDLHIQYVCDRDAGSMTGDEGTWTDNPMMYMHIEQFPVTLAPEIRTELIDPPSWTDPPVKVSPDSSRIIGMQVKNTGNASLNYEVSTYNPSVVVVSGGSGTVLAGESVYVELLIDCQGESFMTDTVVVASDDSTNPHIVHYLHAVCSEDYYECAQDSVTFIEKDNGILRLWACTNTEERLWDQRIAEEERQKIIFSGGVIVATTAGDDTVVGRQDFKDMYTGARDTINVVQGSMEPYIPDEKCIIQKIHVKDTYIWTPHLLPPHDFKWWWIDIHQQIVMFHDNPLSECPNWKKEQVIKYVWIDWSTPPGWWPDPGVYEGHEDIYFGFFADIDAPFDEGCNGCNTAGYDYDRQMVWLHGWYNDTIPEGHPEYEDHYVALAFTDTTGAVVAPWGVQNVLNEEYLYPEGDWGWKDGELYQLAVTPGVNIHHPDSVADRTVVLTADLIPTGTDTTFESEFILIEASIPTGLAGLQAHMDQIREVLMPELNGFYIYLFSKDFPICGDLNFDTVINSADVIYLLNYLFEWGPPPRWPLNRADANGDGTVNSADLVYLLNYLFINGPAPNCSGFGRELK